MRTPRRRQLLWLPSSASEHRIRTSRPNQSSTTPTPRPPRRSRWNESGNPIPPSREAGKHMTRMGRPGTPRPIPCPPRLAARTRRPKLVRCPSESWDRDPWMPRRWTVSHTTRLLPPIRDGVGARPSANRATISGGWRMISGALRTMLAATHLRFRFLPDRGPTG